MSFLTRGSARRPHSGVSYRAWREIVGIESAEPAVALAINLGVGRLRFDRRVAADESGHGPPVRGRADGDGGRPGRAEAGAGMALQRLERRLQNVGDDLHPDPAVSAAVR